ncbi:TetR/AcrR family transcriptional regulator [Algoriphagus sp. H41]|uniref:TetR/AcrR family transcriptional regulator n=1 Tax=Algoriphagus oliviformis TaxID=2811231 RepID=A0ABS3BZX8_9BACT|nr:TetR/AcrR family transcriptional regulator [Algoriphagus oliviformis]MBN7809954.1 TetR/AcrR family transcriptional regulator [Algoriphagus oliviformis]
MAKIKTKDKILSVAIRMFNESGIQGVTSRHIAAEMGISHGNLDYHYHTKEDLLLAIYDKMRAEASEAYTIRESNISSLMHFQRMVAGLEEFQYRYRFFNLDVLEISRSFPEVNKKIQETLILRKQQAQQLFEEFLKDGYVSFPDEDVMERIQHTIRIVITFWLSQLEVISPYKFRQKGEMVRLVWNTILPYLTPAGKEEYDRIQESAPSELTN